VFYDQGIERRKRNHVSAEVGKYEEEVSEGLMLTVFFLIMSLPAIGFGFGIFVGYLIWGTK
jgi:hypothetical protein